jgi:hypothetical protein
MRQGERNGFTTQGISTVHQQTHIKEAEVPIPGHICWWLVRCALFVGTCSATGPGRVLQPHSIIFFVINRRENRYGTSSLSFHMPLPLMDVLHLWSHWWKPRGNDCYPGLTQSKFMIKQVLWFLLFCWEKNRGLFFYLQSKLPLNCSFFFFLNHL